MGQAQEQRGGGSSAGLGKLLPGGAAHRENGDQVIAGTQVSSGLATNLAN